MSRLRSRRARLHAHRGDARLRPVPRRARRHADRVHARSPPTTAAARTSIDQAEDARGSALDVAARQLRNLANPTVNAATTIDRARPYDFIFQTSDPAKTWVRYCLADDRRRLARTRPRLWETESATATLSAGMRGPCPGTGWALAHVVTVEGLQPGQRGRPPDLRLRVRARPSPRAARRPPRTTHASRTSACELYVDDNVERLAQGDARLDRGLPAQPERAADRERHLDRGRPRARSSSTARARPIPRAGRSSSTGSRARRRLPPTSPTARPTLTRPWAAARPTPTPSPSPSARP